jgi:hypothetical protein
VDEGEAFEEESPPGKDEMNEKAHGQRAKFEEGSVYMEPVASSLAMRGDWGRWCLMRR